MSKNTIVSISFYRKRSAPLEAWKYDFPPLLNDKLMTDIATNRQSQGVKGSFTSNSPFNRKKNNNS